MGHLTIVLDMDGVIADFHGTLIEKVGAPKRMDSWKWEDWYPGDEKRQIEAKAFTSSPDSYHFLQPLPGARKSIRKIAEAGNKIYIVTGRPEGADWVTQDWVNKYLRGDIEKVFVVGHASKVGTIKELSPHLVVDDNADTIHQLVEAGIGAVVFNQPWNQDVKDAPRVYGWTHLRKVVLGK